jgi:hypothetical protein
MIVRILSFNNAKISIKKYYFTCLPDMNRFQLFILFMMFMFLCTYMEINVK